MLRSWLEENCWLQGSFISPEDLVLLRNSFDNIPEGEIYLIMASQSCDACASEDKEEFVEFSVARRIERADGNFMYNKNPRRLHLIAETSNSEQEFGKFNLELYAQEKIKLRKVDIKKIKKIKPFKDITLRDTTVIQYANWLAARYNRPALPSAFERRFNDEWKKIKGDKYIKKVSQHIVGVYIDIFPDKEIEDDESYSVNLLFLITKESRDNSEILQKIEELTSKYKQVMIDAGFDMGEIAITIKEEISVATLESYKRLIYDNLSYKNEEPLPPTI